MPTRVHAILEQRQAAVFPGIYDTLSARIAERAGFELAFISGYAYRRRTSANPTSGC